MGMWVDGWDFRWGNPLWLPGYWVIGWGEREWMGGWVMWVGRGEASRQERSGQFKPIPAAMPRPPDVSA
jgi:hypothetical protein